MASTELPSAALSECTCACVRAFVSLAACVRACLRACERAPIGALYSDPLRALVYTCGSRRKKRRRVSASLSEVVHPSESIIVVIIVIILSSSAPSARCRISISVTQRKPRPDARASLSFLRSLRWEIAGIDRYRGKIGRLIIHS